MNDERKMILQMLEEGKISSDEAMELLDAINNSKSNDEKSFEKEFTEKVTNFADKSVDFGTKMAKGFIDVIDKFPEFASSTIDNIGDVFSGNYETINSQLEYDIENFENIDLDIEAINGNITLDSAEENKITIDIIYKYRAGSLEKGEPFYNSNFKDNLLFFEPIKRKNNSMSLNIKMPDILYNNIKLKTSNASIKSKDTINIIRTLDLNTTNSSIVLESFNGGSAKLFTSNGRIIADNIVGDSINANTSNDSIKIDEINGDFINLITTNSRITVDTIKGDEVLAQTTNSSINIDSLDVKKSHLKTSNSNISVGLKDRNSPILLDLSSSIGRIDVEDLHPLIYDTNTKNNILARSENYSEDMESVHIIAKTTNGSIHIE